MSFAISVRFFEHIKICPLIGQDIRKAGEWNSGTAEWRIQPLKASLQEVKHSKGWNQVFMAIEKCVNLCMLNWCEL